MLTLLYTAVNSGLLKEHIILQKHIQNATTSNETKTTKMLELIYKNDNHDIIIIIGIQPLGRFGQRPGLNPVTGMALVCCILGKFLGVVCHCTQT